jgi:hypothetical protein
VLTNGVAPTVKFGPFTAVPAAPLQMAVTRQLYSAPELSPFTVALVLLRVELNVVHLPAEFNLYSSLYVIGVAPTAADQVKFADVVVELTFRL